MDWLLFYWNIDIDAIFTIFMGISTNAILMGIIAPAFPFLWALPEFWVLILEVSGRKGLPHQGEEEKKKDITL
jgi:hypothetical protein